MKKLNWEKGGKIMKKDEGWNCWNWGDGRKGFPTFWVIVLVLAGVWFAGEMGWFTIEFPWFAAILVIIALGAIIDHYVRR